MSARPTEWLVTRLKSEGVLLAFARIAFRGTRRVIDATASRFWQRRLASCGPGLVVQAGARIEKPRMVSAGRGCVIHRGTQIDSELPSGRLWLEDCVQINAHVRLDHSGGLKIGSGTLVSEEVVIFTHSHGMDPRSEPVGLSKQIGANVWIGARAVLLERCRSVGDNAIVAAGAVVAKDVPAGCIAYGNPCQFRIRRDLTAS